MWYNNQKCSSMSDMYTTMTRVWFCPTCFSRRLPKTHHKFLVFGATHGFKFKKAKMLIPMRATTERKIIFVRNLNSTILITPNNLR